MKEYPKIPSSKNFPLTQCFAFNKYDGSNLRWSWGKKKGFYKFGTRTRLFDHTDPDFGPAIPIFMEKFSPQLCELFKQDAFLREQQEITVFTEFFGPRSFGGLHLPDDPKELVMFDVWVYKRGLMGPKEFVKTFSGVVPTAKVIYQGKFGGQFADDVRKGKYASDGVFEGVVCKTGTGGRDLFMCKIKTDAYLTKLKAVFHEKWQNFWE